MTDFAGAARLFYLANELRSPIPHGLVKFMPQGEILQAIASFGVTGVEVGLGLEGAQLKALLKRGSKAGKPTREEWKYLVTNYISEELVDRKDSMNTSEFMKYMDVLSRWLAGGAGIIDTEEDEFSDDGGTGIPKFDSGFEPFDKIVQGFYQGLFVLMGSTGTGKTTHMLSLAEQFRANNLTDSIWYFQTEIPKVMFKYMMKPITQRTKFIPGRDKIFYGLQTTSEIIEMAKSDPAENRIVFHDSPDVLAGGSMEDGRRFELERIFRDLVVLKSICKTVFVCSQVRRKDRSVKITSASEAWSKAWYADVMIGIQKMGFRGTQALMKANVVKNRFGPVDYEIKYQYDFPALLATMDSKSQPRIAGWSDEGEDAEEDW